MKALYVMRNKMRQTRKEIAEHMGVSVTTVYRWESGDRQPRTKMLQKLATYFNTTIDALLNPIETAEPKRLPSTRGIGSTLLRKDPRTR